MGTETRGETIDVLIVTAADGEDDAVRAVSTSARGAWRELSRPNDYDFAIWGCEFETPSGRPLRVALTKAVNMGVEAAGHTAAVLTAHYKPRCLAMCGVCAGRVGWTELGDVIIADRVYRYDAGELVNTVPGGTERFNGDLFTYPFRAQWKQRAEQLRVPKDAPWLAERPRPRELQENWLLTEVHGGRDPGASAERKLACPDFTEVSTSLLKRGWLDLDATGKPSLTTEGLAHIRQVRFTHPDGLPEPAAFQIHVGPLATGSNLVRDIDIWKKLPAEHQRLVRGLDMEASVVGFAAFVDQIPWVVAKGVMDFAEPARPQGFRKFAARAAAEVLLAFLREHLEPGSLSAGEILQSGTATRPPSDKNPGSLLVARHEVVDFIDSIREKELRDLGAWCDAAETLSTRLFTGAGGSGKTRLFIEFAKRLRAQGWDAGFLPESATEDHEKALFESPRSTLIVIDYAETRRTLARFLDTALERSAAGGKLRIVLAAREIADWWGALIQHSSQLKALLQAHLTTALQPIAIVADQRLEVYRRAVATFVPVLGKSAPPVEPDLANERFGRVLYLEMAALAAVEGLNLNAEQLLDGVVEHERRYWLRRYREETGSDLLNAADFTDRVARLVAAATLHGKVSTREEVEALSVRVGGPSEERFPHVLRLLHGLYPEQVNTTQGARSDSGALAYLTALEPDLLGECLVERVLEHGETPKDYLACVFDGASPAALRQGFFVLGRIGGRKGGERVERWVGAVVSVDVSNRARAALEAALTHGKETAHSPLGRALHAVLVHGGTPELAVELAPLIPDETVSLREVALWVTRTRVASLPANPSDERERSERARRLNNLGRNLNALGRREDALTATEEAVRLYRTLAQERPVAFLPGLALSLNNLSVDLNDLGRREDALTATEEAVRIHRALLKERPDVFSADLAASLNNLGVGFTALGRHEEALTASEEAVRLYRTLAQERPDAFLPNLAMSLSNLSVDLNDLGRREDALTANEEAVRLYRTLAQERPDAFLPNLAASLNNLGSVFNALGRLEEALAATEEAVRITLPLARAYPLAFAVALRGRSANLAADLSKAGRNPESSATLSEARRLLAEIDGKKRPTGPPMS